MRKNLAFKMISAALVIVVLTVIIILFISLRQNNAVFSNKTSLSHTESVMRLSTELELQSAEHVISARNFMNNGAKTDSVNSVRQLADIREAIKKLLAFEETDQKQFSAIDTLARVADRLSILFNRVLVVSRQDRENKNRKLEESRIKTEYNRELAEIRNYAGLIRKMESGERTEQENAYSSSLRLLNTLLYAVLVFAVLAGVSIFIAIRKQLRRHDENERKFYTLLEAAPDATVISNQDGQIIMVNWQAERMFGYSKKEFAGMRVEELIPGEIRKRHIGMRDGYFSKPKSRSMDTGEMEMQALCKDGTLVPVEISLSPIETSEGRLVTAAIRDITQRKKSQEEIQLLYSQIYQASEAIFVSDKEQLIRTWNKGAEKLYGFTQEEAIGRNSFELLRTVLSEEEYAAANEELNRNNYWTGNLVRYNKEGLLLQVHVSQSAIRNNAGEVSAYVSVSYDMSAEIKLRDQVNYLASLVEQSGEGIISVDRNFLIISWNKGAEQLFGYKAGEIAGKSMLELGIAKYSKQQQEADFLKMTDAGGWNREETVYNRNGQSFFATITASPVKNERGEIVSFLYVIRDLTLRKKYEEQLKRNNAELEEKILQRTHEIQESEHQYRYLFENNPMPMWVFDLDTFQFLDVNEMAVAKYGYSREEFLVMKLTDIRPESEKSRFRSFDHAWRVSSTESNRGVWKHCRKDGSEIDVEVFAHSISFHGRKARLVLLNDVTGRIKSERELVASEKKFRALIENNNDIITLFNAEGQIIYRSPSAQRIMGWSDEEVGDLSFIDDVVHPEDRSRLAEVRRDVVNSPGVPYQTFYRGRHKDGHYVYLEGTMINLLHRNYVQAIVFNIRDVSVQKKAEERLLAREKRFRSLIENSFDIIILLDDKFRVTYRSPSAERITGRSDAEVFGKDPREHIHPDDLPRISEGIRSVMTSPGSTEYALFRFRHHDGVYVWMEGYATNLLQDDAVKAIVFNYRDVTARMEAEEKLKASEKRYRLTLDNMMEGVQIIGFDWKYKYLNKAVVAQAKTTQEQLLGRTMMEAYPGIENTEVYRLISRCFTERMPLQVENRFVLPDSTVTWSKLSIQPSPEGVFILSEDITEKLETAESLKAEQQKLDSIAASSPGLIYSFRMAPDGSFSFPYASNALEELFGFGHGVITDNIVPLLDATVKEDQLIFINSIHESANNMKPWNLEFRFHHPRKGIIWLEGSSIPRKDPDGGITWHGIIMDVTERKKVQEKISEQSAQLKTLSNNLPGVMIFQLAGTSFEDRRFTYVSSEVTRLTGKTPEEVLADPFLLYNIIFEEDRQRLIKAELESFQRFSVFNEEVRCYDTAGQMHWLNIVSTPRKTEQGLMVWDGFHMDITDRKNAENAIRESEEKYRTVVDQAFDGILFYNEAGIILDCNNSACATIGYTREELLRLNVTQLFFEEDLEMRSLDIPQVKTGVQVFDFRTMKRKDGSSVEIELVTRQLPDGRFVAMGRDITDQNKALSQQNLLSSIVNFSDDAIISTNLDGIITSWNKGAEKVYGYTAEEMTGRGIHLLAPDSKWDDEKEILSRLKLGENIHHFETRRKRKDGKLIDVSITASPLYNKEKISGVSKIVRDISRRKADEKHIRVSNERYEAVARATSDAIWDYDYQTGKTFIAGTGYKYLFGYDLVNKYSEPGFWESRLHPDDTERVMNEMEAVKNDFSRNQSSVEYRFRKADGSYAYVNDRFFILRDDAGNSIRLLGAKQDITLRKEAEQELRRNVIEKQLLLERLSVILNTLPASVALLDTSGVVVEVNEAWKNFSDINGFSDTNYGIGTGYLTTSTLSFGNDANDGKLISEGILKVLSGKAQEFEYEYSWHLPKLKRWFRIVAVPLKGKEFNGAVVMNTDISEIRKLELERIESKIEEQKKITEAMLRGQEKERNAIGIELHDNVNQILVGTKVLLSVVRDYPEKNEELLPSCIDNISMAIQENRKIAHELVTPNLSEETLVQQITRLSQTMLKNAGINTYINSESFNEKLLSNEMKLALYRVAQEQCTNIIKYAEAGQVIISLATKRELFIMRIADDGNGMDIKNVTHGIGLKNISSRLGVFGGTINIDTAPGQGFALEIEIPLVVPVSAPAAS